MMMKSSILQAPDMLLFLQFHSAWSLCTKDMHAKMGIQRHNHDASAIDNDRGFIHPITMPAADPAVTKISVGLAGAYFMSTMSYRVNWERVLLGKPGWFADARSVSIATARTTISWHAQVMHARDETVLAEHPSDCQMLRMRRPSANASDKILKFSGRIYNYRAIGLKLLFDE